MKTRVPKADQIEKKWYIVDASDQVLGRLASKIATIIRGKNKPYFSPNLDVGDNIIVINAEKVIITGNKDVEKLYDKYSGYPDGLRQIPFNRLMEEQPEEVIKHAVKGMLPKNALGRKLFRNLKVYCGEKHPHEAQKPTKLDLKSN